MKVLLIMPPLNRLMGAKLAYFPIGLGYLAGHLKAQGTEAKIYNAENPDQAENLKEITNRLLFYQYDTYVHSLKNENHFVWQEIEEVLREFSPDIVGLSVTTAKFGSSLKISSLIKKHFPGCYVVWGGAHPTIKPDEVLQNKEVDFAVRGEGEVTLSELIQEIRTNPGGFSEIKGLSYRRNGDIVHNADRQLMENLDELTFPDKTAVIFPERYLPWDMGVMVTSRGCPFECAFCGAQNIWGRKVRCRSIDNIIAEIKEIISRYNTKQIFFWDDTFNLDRKRLMALCQRLIDERIGISWRCTARPDLLDEELLRIMKQAGCGSIDIGIESGSDRILQSINKGYTLEQIFHGIELIRRSGINFNAFFMIGFPDETEEDIQKTFDLMKRKEMGTLILSIFTPYPGTKLYQRADDLGLIPKPLDWSFFSHQSPYNHFVKEISKARFRELAQEISTYVDQHNKSFRLFLKMHQSEIPFYAKNPLIFFRKLKEKIRYGVKV